LSIEDFLRRFKMEEEDEDELPLSSVGMLRRLTQEEPDFMPLINV
jgi:hypothetical protein